MKRRIEEGSDEDETPMKPSKIQMEVNLHSDRRTVSLEVTPQYDGSNLEKPLVIEVRQNPKTGKLSHSISRGHTK